MGPLLTDVPALNSQLRMKRFQYIHFHSEPLNLKKSPVPLEPSLLAGVGPVKRMVSLLLCVSH